MIDIEKLKVCSLCPRLCESRSQVVPSHGPTDARIMIIGQAPGYEEDRVGKGFQGKSGAHLRKLLASAGIDMDKCHISNVVKCFPAKNRKPLKSEIKNCSTAWLLDEIAALRPEMIIAVGDVALQVLKPGEKISQIHGQTIPLELGNLNMQLFTTYHPAAAMYDQSLQPILINDFKNLGAKPKKQEGWTLVLTELKRVAEKTVAVDFETTEPVISEVFAPVLADPRGVALAWRDPKAGVKAFYHATQNISLYHEMLSRPDSTKICHNAKFEYMVAKRQGITMQNFHDTKLMAYVLGMPSTNLKDLSGTVLNVRQQRYEEWNKVSPEYPAGDAAYTFLLAEQLSSRLEEEGLWNVYADIDLPVVQVLAEMEMAGVRVDLDKLKVVGSQLEAIKAKIQEEFGGYNFGKDAQIRLFLYEDLGLPVLRRTKTGLPSVEKDILVRLAAKHPEPARVLDWNEADSLLTKYVNTLPKLLHEDGRIHGRFNQAGRYEDYDSDRAGTTTGRLSSSSPNLQNIPHRTDLGRLVRSTFVPVPGYRFVRADISQEEPRIAAFLAGDKTMLDRLNRGEDLYLPIAQRLYDTVYPEQESPKHRVTTTDKKWRDPAKTIWLGKLYGAGSKKIIDAAAEFGINITAIQATSIDKWFNQEYPYIVAFANEQFAFLTEHGYVQSWFGRRRWIPKGITGNQKEKAAAKREAANMPVQGTAGDVMKIMLRRIYDALRGHDARLVLTVHDEVVVEAAEKEVEYVRGVLVGSTKDIMPIDLPVDVSKTGEDTWK